MSYEALWDQSDHTPQLCIIKVPSSTGTTGSNENNLNIIIRVENLTTANIVVKPSRETVIQYWQLKKLPTIQKDILKQFSTLRQREDNWDNFNSKKPNRLSLSHAEGLINDFLDVLIDEGYIWLKPFISSEEDGNVTIEWHKGNHELHIEVNEDEAEYIKVWGTNIENDMHLGSLQKSSYLTLWNWLLHG